MKLTQPLFWLLTLLWFAAGAWWYSSSSCSTCNTAAAIEPVVDKPAVSVALPALMAQDSNWMVQNADNLRFGKSTDVPVLSTSVTATIDSIAQYIHGSKIITVTGHYSSSEKNSTVFENLGLARADAMKKILIAKGVAEKNIVTTAVLTNDLYFTPADTLIGGISFGFASAIQKPVNLLFEPRTVYFNTGKNTFNVTQELAGYLEAAKKYLQANADKKLMITGYTDNVGDPDKNIQLSAARAAFVKTALAQKGIAETQIQTAGKGMADPIADNTTADGKAKNRRVTITLQ